MLQKNSEGKLISNRNRRPKKISINLDIIYWIWSTNIVFGPHLNGLAWNKSIIKSNSFIFNKQYNQKCKCDW